MSENVTILFGNIQLRILCGKSARDSSAETISAISDVHTLLVLVQERTDTSAYHPMFLNM